MTYSRMGQSYLKPMVIPEKNNTEYRIIDSNELGILYKSKVATNSAKEMRTHFQALQS